MATLTMGDMRKLPDQLRAFEKGPVDDVLKKKVHQISQNLGVMLADELAARGTHSDSKRAEIPDDEPLSDDVAEELHFLTMLMDRFSQIET
jgi:hypothetical protein